MKVGRSILIKPATHPVQCMYAVLDLIIWDQKFKIFNIFIARYCTMYIPQEIFVNFSPASMTVDLKIITKGEFRGMCIRNTVPIVAFLKDLLVALPVD